MGPFGTAARATQLVLPRTSVRPIAWDDDKAPRWGRGSDWLLCDMPHSVCNMCGCKGPGCAPPAHPPTPPPPRCLGCRPLMRLIIFYAADASEAGQVRIKGVFMEWIAQGRMGQLINYYVLSDCCESACRPARLLTCLPPCLHTCLLAVVLLASQPAPLGRSAPAVAALLWHSGQHWHRALHRSRSTGGYCEGDLKKSWARAAPPSYVTGIEVAYDDRVRSIKFNLTGGVQVAAGPADG